MAATWIGAVWRCSWLHGSLISHCLFHCPALCKVSLLMTIKAIPGSGFCEAQCAGIEEASWTVRGLLRRGSGFSLKSIQMPNAKKRRKLKSDIMETWADRQRKLIHTPTLAPALLHFPLGWFSLIFVTLKRYSGLREYSLCFLYTFYIHFFWFSACSYHKGIVVCCVQGIQICPGHVRVKQRCMACYKTQLYCNLCTCVSIACPGQDPAATSMAGRSMLLSS